MLRTHWTPGPAAFGGPLLVSLTEFTGDSPLDLPATYRAGLDLRRSWPDLQGAVGMWLWARPWSLTSGSVAVWQDEAALRRFVSWPPHMAIVRRFRDRGRVRATTWETTASTPGRIREEAAHALEGLRLSPTP